MQHPKMIQLAKKISQKLIIVSTTRKSVNIVTKDGKYMIFFTSKTGRPKIVFRPPVRKGGKK